MRFYHGRALLIHQLLRPSSFEISNSALTSYISDKPVALGCAPRLHGISRGQETMALRNVRVIGPDGDRTLAEWDTDTVSPEQLDEIEMQFNQKMRQGFFAADITDGRNVLIKKFDPKANILLIPRVRGG